ncbi:MAG TPA: PepSY domain-containing protein [Clostridia bacterium]|nr:PepSY domain-containing protein [Clostridia bacterium]
MERYRNNRNIRNRWLLLILLPLLMLVLVSCGVNDSARDVENADSENIAENGREVPPEISEKITPMDVYDMYMEKFPNTEVYKVELERDDGKYVYEIKGFDSEKEYKLKFYPKTGQLRSSETVRKKTEEGKIRDVRFALAKSNIEKIEGFVDKVMGEFGEGTTLSEWTLKMKNNRPEIEIEVDRVGQKDIEHTYNIETGELLEVDD